MKLNSEITKKDYSKLMTTHLVKSPYMIFILIMGIAFLVFYIQLPEQGLFYLFLGLGFIGMPILTYFTIGQAYNRNKHFNEKIEFNIDDKNMELVGQTFRSIFPWTQITQIKETEKFFSFHQGRILMSLMKKEGNDQEAIDKLRLILKSTGKLK